MPRVKKAKKVVRVSKNSPIKILKAYFKKRGIKGYSSLNQVETRNLFLYFGKYRKYIVDDAKKAKIKGYAKLTKAELVNALLKIPAYRILIISPPIPHPPIGKPPGIGGIIPPTPKPTRLFKHVIDKTDVGVTTEGGWSLLGVNYVLELILKNPQIRGLVRVVYIVEDLLTGKKEIPLGAAVAQVDANGFTIQDAQGNAIFKRTQTDFEYKIPQNKISYWWKKNKKYYDWFSPESGYSIFESTALYTSQSAPNPDKVGKLNKNFKCTILFLTPSKMNKTEIIQNFAEGKTHCLFNPIIQLCEKKIKSEIAKHNKIEITPEVNNLTNYGFGDCEIQLPKSSTYYNYKSIMDKSIKYADLYKEGVPETKLQSVAHDLGINIIIKDLLGSSKEYKASITFTKDLTGKIIEYQTTKKSLTTFTYVNNEINHVSNENDNTTKINEIIDLLKIDCENSSESINITEPAMKLLYEELKSKNFPFMFTGKSPTPTTILCTDKLFKLETDYSKAEKLFMEKTGLKTCQIDHIKYPELVKFLSNGTYIPTSVDFVENFLVDANKLKKDNTLRQIDMSKAYTQFSKCGLYQGFMPNVTTFCDIDDSLKYDDYLKFLSEKVGIYYVEDISFEKCKHPQFIKLCEKLNCYRTHVDAKDAIYEDYDEDDDMVDISNFNKGDMWRDEWIYSNDDPETGIGDEELIQVPIKMIEPPVKEHYTNSITLPSPELMILLLFGVTFKLKTGAWCDKTLKFEFDNSMKQKIFDSEEEKERNVGLSYFAKFAGKSMIVKKEKCLKTHCSKEIFQVLYNKYGEKVKYWKHNNECCFYSERDYGKTLTHITAFLTSYMRINMINQLMKMNLDKVLRVCMDGIYFEDHEFKMDSTFLYKPKDACPHIPGSSSAESYFYPNTKKINLDIPFRDGALFELHFGAAGCGKSYDACKTKALINVIYTAVCKRRCSQTQKDYGLECRTLASILSDKNQYINPSVIIIDECTMISHYDRQKLQVKFPYSKLIFIGDIDPHNITYQLPSITKPGFNVSGITYFKEYTTNYRTADSDLLKILNSLRSHIYNEQMKISVLPFSNVELVHMLTKYFGNHVLKPDDVANYYKITDHIICSRTSCTTCQNKKINKNKPVNCTCGKDDSQVREWTKRFAGKFNQEKYVCIKNCDDYNNGDIIITDEKIKNKNVVVRHANTVHSVQGDTVDTKLFIDLRKLFGGLQMVYTALSRANKIDNIFIII